MSKTNPVFFCIDSIDSRWALEQSQQMMQEHLASETSNASGKFYSNYECWHFHSSSKWPLIQKVKSSLEEYADQLKIRLNKKLRLDFFVLSRVKTIGQPISIWHKDGYFFDGQFHLTIQGNAKIESKVQDSVQTLYFPNGQCWYLNGSEHYHRVVPNAQERIELCAPLNQLQSDVDVKKKAILQDGRGWVDGKNTEWTQLRQQQIQYVKKAIEKGSASNLEKAHFCL